MIAAASLGHPINMERHRRRRRTAEVREAGRPAPAQLTGGGGGQPADTAAKTGPPTPAKNGQPALFTQQIQASAASAIAGADIAPGLARISATVFLSAASRRYYRVCAGAGRGGG